MKPNLISPNAFSTRYDHFQFSVLRYDTTNDITLLKDIANSLYASFPEDFVSVNLSNILAYCKTMWERLTYIEMKLKRLKKELFYGV